MLSRQAVVVTLALVVTIPVLAYSAEPMGSAPAAKMERPAHLPTSYSPSTAYIQATSEAATKAVESMQFRNIGPAIMGGRVADLAVVDDNPSVFYVGTASGGVWKTVNHGTSFEPVFDHESTSSIGDVTVSQRNPNLVWVGTGEPNNRQSSPYGNGVYRSLDGGANWQHMGLDETRHIGRIQIDHRDNNRVFIGAVGHLWGPNEERGVFRTTDAGQTWEKVLFINEDTGVIDLAMDPHDSNTLFAAAYQRRRTAGGFNGGGSGSGIYRTMDGGDTWERLAEGLPQGDMGRIGLDIYRRDPDIVFATVEAGGGRGGVYRSTDRGNSWEHLSTQNNRPMYYSQIRVDPSDPNWVYSGGLNIYASSDGGRTFRGATAEVHSDHHAMWIDPNNSNNLIIAGDGGISVSFDRTRTWRQLRNIVISQFYEIGVDMREPYFVCGGLQDNGSWCGPSRTLTTLGIRNRDWYNIGGGDGFYVRIDPTDSSVLFGESQGGNVYRKNLITGESQRIRPLPRAQGQGPDSGEEVDFAWNWNTPMLISEHDNRLIYIGSSHLMKSADRGVTWEAVSPDVTTGVNRDDLEIMGTQVQRGTTLSANDGISSYGNLTTISESPTSPNVLYVGTDDGNIHGTRDAGTNWVMLSGDMPGLAAPNTVVTRVVASRFNEGRVYATFDGHERDDYRPYVYRSDDYGNTWEPIVSGLPDDATVNIIVEHPRNENLLFLGNEIGVFVSIDRGDSWAQLKNNLPTVPVDDIVIHPRENDLVLGTHGRGIWILDDITPLEEISEDVLNTDAHIFSARRTPMWRVTRWQEWSPGTWRVSNPAPGARIHYYLKEDAPLPSPTVDARRDDGGGRSGGRGGGRGGANQMPSSVPATPPEPTVKLTVLDGNGGFVREFEGPGRAGVQTALWDFRIADAYTTTTSGGGFGGGGRRGGGGGPRGPEVLPDTYTVRLEAGGRTTETTVEVVLDPRIQVPMDVLQDRQDAMMDAYNLAKPVYEARQAIGAINDQLNNMRGLLSDDAPEALTSALDDITRDVRQIQENMQEAGAGAGAVNTIQSFAGEPTADQLWQIDQSWRLLPGVIEQINVVITDRMPGLIATVYQPGVGPGPLDTIEIPTRPTR
tara:strand:+ start:848 stop:4183 length:3336 start_codon:yes stop_codon:yes gene_type:complete